MLFACLPFPGLPVFFCTLDLLYPFPPRAQPTPPPRFPTPYCSHLPRTTPRCYPPLHTPYPHHTLPAPRYHAALGRTGSGTPHGARALPSPVLFWFTSYGLVGQFLLVVPLYTLFLYLCDSLHSLFGSTFRLPAVALPIAALARLLRHLRTIWLTWVTFPRLLQAAFGCTTRYSTTLLRVYSCPDCTLVGLHAAPPQQFCDVTYPPTPPLYLRAAPFAAPFCCPHPPLAVTRAYLPGWHRAPRCLYLPRYYLPLYSDIVYYLLVWAIYPPPTPLCALLPC